MTTKIKTFTCTPMNIEKTEKEINEFIKNREGIKVHMIATNNCIVFCVEYQVILVE